MKEHDVVFTQSHVSFTKLQKHSEILNKISNYVKLQITLLQFDVLFDEQDQGGAVVSRQPIYNLKQPGPPFHVDGQPVRHMKLGVGFTSFLNKELSLVRVIAIVKLVF